MGHRRERRGIKKCTFSIFLTGSLAHGTSNSVSSLDGKIQTCVSNCMFGHEVANICADELKLIRAKTNRVTILANGYLQLCYVPLK